MSALNEALVKLFGPSAQKFPLLTDRKARTLCLWMPELWFLTVENDAVVIVCDTGGYPEAVYTAPVSRSLKHKPTIEFAFCPTDTGNANAKLVATHSNDEWDIAFGGSTRELVSNIFSRPFGLKLQIDQFFLRELKPDQFVGPETVLA